MAASEPHEIRIKEEPLSESKSQAAASQALPPPIEPMGLSHTLFVRSGDGKVSSLLCPLELVMESANLAAPLIPEMYDPQLFCVIENVQSNCFEASDAISGARPSKASKGRNAKNGKRKRKKSTSADKVKPTKKRKIERIPKMGLDEMEMDDLEMEGELEFGGNAETAARYRTRPKRKRKTVSYRDSDLVAQLQPPFAVQPKTENVSEQKTQAMQSQSQSAPVTAKVEMRWVQCDLCLKWRRIPTSISEGELKGEWSCSMNKWDLLRNSCAAPEEAYGDEETLEVKNGAETSTVCEKRREFYGRLETFYASDAMAAKQLSVGALREQRIGGKHVDFLQLYLEITKRGGYHYCIAGKLWDEVFACLQCFTAGEPTAKDTLKELYRRFLSDYEQMYYVPPKEHSNQPFEARI